MIKAVHWYTKSAEQGSLRGDDKQALHSLTKSAEQGDARAQNDLALMY